MPIYEYRCASCGETSSFLEGVGKGKLELKCKYCGSNELQKVFSTISVLKSGRNGNKQGGLTCCGRTERCENPPCNDEGSCKR